MNMTENKIVANNGSSIVLYTTDDGNTQLEVKLEKDTVWLNRAANCSTLWQRLQDNSKAYQ